MYTAPWYPGHPDLLRGVEEVRDQLEAKEVELEVVDVEVDLASAEERNIIAVPTAVLTRDGKERRRVSGALGLVELRGLAGLRSRARKIPR